MLIISVEITKLSFAKNQTHRQEENRFRHLYFVSSIMLEKDTSLDSILRLKTKRIEILKYQYRGDKENYARHSLYNP
jgi:hypothetical protein